MSIIIIVWDTRREFWIELWNKCCITHWFKVLLNFWEFTFWSRRSGHIQTISIQVNRYSMSESESCMRKWARLEQEWNLEARTSVGKQWGDPGKGSRGSQSDRGGRRRDPLHRQKHSLWKKQLHFWNTGEKQAQLKTEAVLPFSLHILQTFHILMQQILLFQWLWWKNWRPIAQMQNKQHTSLFI